MLSYPISVFLDTNIFISAKYDFSLNGIFNTLLKQINDGKIVLYISNIVQHEVENHIEEEFLRLRANFKRASRESTDKISLNLAKQMSIAYLFEKLDKDAIKVEAVSVFRKFIIDSKVTILDNSNVDCSQIVSDYFSSILPFESNDNKKYEFPDAIMAAKLKTEFSDKNPVFIISNDTGFRNSFKDQKGFTTFESLKELFDLINKETQIYQKITSFILDTVVYKSICDQIKYELENKDLEVDGRDCDRKGLCEGYDYEEVYITGISQVDFELSSVDDITENAVSVTLSCTAFIIADSSYFDEANSAWDSEEREYVFSAWGKVEEKHRPNFDCEVVFSIDRREDVGFEVETINFDISLDQWSRVERAYIHSDDSGDIGEIEEV